MRFSVRLRTLNAIGGRVQTGQRFFALGQATRLALRRSGIHEVEVPSEATSEGLLALPGLHSVNGRRIGIVTAPGGRGLLIERLRERGAELAIAEVYARAPARLDGRHVRSLLEARGHGAVCVTSAEALRNVLMALPDDARQILIGCAAVVSSARLEAIARDAGFQTVLRALAPAPRCLMDALCMHASGHRFR